jgi:hypothetical protein
MNCEVFDAGGRAEYPSTSPNKVEKQTAAPQLWTNQLFYNHFLVHQFGATQEQTLQAFDRTLERFQRYLQLDRKICLRRTFAPH